jgi:hypothetical protein
MAVGTNESYSLLVIKLMENYKLSQGENLPKIVMGEHSYHASDFNDIAWSHDNEHIYT